jgi:chromosome transmission fidelity protein 18
VQGQPKLNFPASPALSQISRDGPFPFTPAPRDVNKKTSTPFFDKIKNFEVPPKDPENDVFNEIQNIGVKRKRRLEDLFGDIYDIDEDDANFKKPKTDEERDLETIQKILDARKAFVSIVNPLKRTEFDKLESLHKFKRDNITKTVPKYPFITISHGDDRIYVRNHSEQFEEIKLAEIKAYDRSKQKLLDPDVWKNANEIVLKATSLTQQQPIENQPALHSNNESVDLWVEKYKPKKYLELLSEESINRSLLQWIKLWDKIVFNREIFKKSKPGEMNSFNKRTGKFEQNGGWKKRRQGNLNTDLDENKVPVQKIALLVGKPGLGKSTLAHVIARHAGYVVREVNASDDRNIDSFKQVLENGTQMTSVLNQENRPNCIILDEIDGAPAASIDFLIKFSQGQVKEKSKKSGTKGNSKKIVLRRPIICICNDLYGANLRALRQVAFIVNFSHIDNAKLAERLVYISEKEKVKTDLTSMLALAEKTSGDIRSCLSMIQFSSCSKKRLTLLDIMRSNIGSKDQHESLFNVWRSIFQIQRPKKVVKNDANNQQVVGMSDMSSETRMKNILEMISSCGEYEKLMTGIHENFLKQKFQDTTMEGIVEANRWFIFNDSIQTKINQLQNYSVYPYLPYSFVNWHFVFGSLTYPHITYPQKQYEVTQKLTTTKMTFESLKKGLSSYLRGFGSGHEILLDSISLVKIIICPEIRSVSMHLLTERERNDLQHTVEIIADLGLTMTQLQAADGTYTYRVDPDIDYLSSNFISNQTKYMSYWSKQIIAREVELEKMRRAKPKVQGESNIASPAKNLNLNDKKVVENNNELPNHLQKLMPKTIHNNKKGTTSTVRRFILSFLKSFS